MKYIDQVDTLDYIFKVYIPLREEWAECFIRRYRNFGQRVNSPVETAHKDVKSYLLNGTGDLFHLHNALIQMIEKKRRVYEQKSAAQKIQQRHKYAGQQWLGQLTFQIGYTAIDLLAERHRYVLLSIEKPLVVFISELLDMNLSLLFIMFHYVGRISSNLC